DVVAVLHHGRGERAEEEEDEPRQRERLDLLGAVREVVEDERRGGERGRARDQPRHGRAVEAQDAILPAHAMRRTSVFPCRIPPLMRWSQSFIPTLREVPSDADVVSQRLMMRAGMIRKVAAGIYTYLPLGLRSMQKLEAIIREEMNRAGAVELLGPTIHPGELWMESKRWQRYGKELLRIKDRHERDFVYGPTAEEVVTDAVRNALNSYRSLPVNLYQIQTKFRDEVRPRFGLMRGREFVMKDAYSFHANRESLDEIYEKMRVAYGAIFNRCALDHVAVDADTGNIGGSASHEFMVLAQSGEDAVVSCPNCSYGANVEKATSKFFLDEPDPAPMTELAPIHTPGTQTIDDVGKFLGKPTSQLVKTLVFDTDQGCVMVL